MLHLMLSIPCRILNKLLSLGFRLSQFFSNARELFLTAIETVRLKTRSSTLAGSLQGPQSVTHLAIILPEGPKCKNDAAINEVASLALWCIQSRIRILSVYVRAGFSNAIRQSAQSLITQHLQQSGLDLGSSQVLISARDNTITPPDKANCSLCVQLMQLEDGQDAILDLAGRLVDLKRNGKLDGINHEADAEDKITKMVDEMNGPSPELIIAFGSRHCLRGYPPWLLRYPEIHFIPDFPRLRRAQFTRALKQFSQAEMRYGQ